VIAVSGVVRAVGVNVKHFKPGERVLALSHATYAELVAVDDLDVSHLPDGVPGRRRAAARLRFTLVLCLIMSKTTQITERI